LRYRTDRRTRLALLPIGYADGIPRNISDVGDRPGATVLLRGRRVPIVGTVSMDQLILDVGDAGVGPGEVATLFGPGDDGEPTLRDWAGWAATIEHDIVTRIGPRVARETVGAEPTGTAERVALRAVDAA
jgi:alanine racemase